MAGDLYHVPVLSRFDFGLFRSAGPGLGNLMFPIARAVVGVERHGGIVVAPTIRQLKLGPILRNEPDKRIYGDVVAHRSLRDWTNKFEVVFRSKVSEEEVADDPPPGTAITYRGLRKFFHDIEGHEAAVGTWFRRKARLDEVVPNDYDIAIHVRLGDFAKADPSQSGHSIRQPFDWYRQALDKAFERLGGCKHRIVVFTDSTAEAIEPLTRGLSVDRDPGRNALTSMFNMSRASLIITSRSTFSMWAAYLGATSAIWDAAFDIDPFFPLRENLDIRI